MSVQKMWEVSLNIVQIPVFVAVIIIMVKKTGKRRGLFAAFFIFAMVALALEDIYWVAYDFLRPDTWMPFAADEVAGSAAMLLLGSALSTKIDGNFKAKTSELVFNIAFLGGCAWLWIAWSGEWIQDIVFTLPYVYYLYVLLRGMRSTKALKKAETVIAVMICTAVIVLNIIGLYVSENVAEVLCNVGYVILNGTTVFLLAKIICSRRRGRAAEAVLFLSFALLLWVRLVVYLSSGPFYIIGLFMCIPTIPVMLITLIPVMDKEVSGGENAMVGGVT